MVRAMSRHKAWWGLAIALVAVGAWLATAGRVGAEPATISVGSASGFRGDEVTVGVTVTPAPGELVGAFTIDLVYDGSRLDVVGCTPEAVCNTAFAVNTVRWSAANPAGFSGPVGTVTFRILPTAPLGDASLTLNIVECADETGRSLDCTAQSGSVTVQEQPTPTPTPTPEPTPTPTPTPRALPPTGGESPAAGGGMNWALVAGIAMVASGVAVAGWRLRRGLS